MSLKNWLANRRGRIISVPTIERYDILNKNDAELRADELRRLIDYHNQKYYNEDSPEIDDFEYDKLLRELENIEAEYPELITTNSPTQKVGGNASGEK